LQASGTNKFAALKLFAPLNEKPEHAPVKAPTPPKACNSSGSNKQAAQKQDQLAAPKPDAKPASANNALLKSTTSQGVKVSEGLHA
jgi:hypothetical protein